MSIADLTITSLETLAAFDITTGALKFVMDELQSASISQSEETTEITGRAGRRLATLKRNQSFTLSGTNGMLSAGLLELQTGDEFRNGSTKVNWQDYLTVDDNHTAQTSYVAFGTTGAEIENLYIKNADGTLGNKLEQAASAAEGKFAYDPATKTITLHTDIAAGTELYVSYSRKIVADVLENDPNNYAGKCKVYIDALAEDKCANVYRVQIYIPKADFSGEFSIDMGDSQVVHNFEASALAGACGTNGYLWSWTVFGVNTEDEA